MLSYTANNYSGTYSISNNTGKRLNNVKLNLDAASFYVNIVDSIVFLGMSEMNLIKLFTYDTTCLLEKEENVIFDIHSNCTYDYVYSFDYLDAYFLIKDKKVVRTYNDWSYSYGLEIPYYLKTKKRIGYD